MNKRGLARVILGVFLLAVAVVLLIRLLSSGDRSPRPVAMIASAVSHAEKEGPLTPRVTGPENRSTDRAPGFDPLLLKRLRLAWNSRSTEPDPALPATNQIILANRVVSTQSPGAEYAGPFTPRGTAPFLVQLADGVGEDDRAPLAAAGVTFISYLPENGWLVEMSPAVRRRVASHPLLRWSAPLEAGDKIQPFLHRLAGQFPSDSRRVAVTILCLNPADVDSVSRWLREQGAPVLAAEATAVGGVVKARLTPDQLSPLAAMPEVQWIEEAVPRDLHNDRAVIGTHLNATNVWTAYGLTGKGQIVGHADTGLDIGSTNGIHPDFAGRVLAAFALGRTNTWSDVDSHGTHTAGSIMGSGAMSAGQYRGVAWEAQIVHQSLEDSGGGLGGLPNDLTTLFAPTYSLGARIHSDSWGGGVYGQYTVDSMYADNFMWNNPAMLLVFSAGNEGIDGDANGVVDFDSMGAPATAKNLLTVGAMENDRPSSAYGYTWRRWGASAWPGDYPAEPIYNDYLSWSYTPSPAYLQGMAAFSSRGPTDDGRIKPDVVAPGTDIISCRSRAASGSGWGVAANNNYIYDGGTSMSCPLTAGAMLLIRQYLVERAGVTNPSAALMKAMAVAGARSMAPGQYGTNTYQEIPGSTPNNVEGFGQVNVEQTVYPTGIAVRVTDYASVANRKTATTNFTVLAAGAPVTVALVWTDYPGSTLGGGSKLVNNYDLTVVTPGGQTLYPNGGAGADSLNPVEVVRIPQATNGVYTINVYGARIQYSAGRYALVVRGALDQPPNLLHTSPGPVLSSTNACSLSALVTYFAPLTNGQVTLNWTTNGSAGPFTAIPMTWQGGHVYSGSIPSQPIGQAVQYYLSATVSTWSLRYPTNAPQALQQVVFSNPLVGLDISGTRTNSIIVTPAYGHYAYPSGSLVQASAQPVCASGTTWRFVCDGWRATGALPTNGASSAADIMLQGDAVLTWLWGEEALLTQNSSPAGAVSQTSWHRKNTRASTVQAWDFATYNLTLSYALAGWKIDSVLWTNALRQAANPATNILMNTPHTATAWYLPLEQDGNTNGLFDWWEYRMAGNTGVVSAAADSDGDGWINRMESLDNTDPFNSNSLPRPPVLTVTPPAAVQTASPPWRVSAVITDNFAVAEAAVLWSVNGGPQMTNWMTYSGNNIYTADLDPGSRSVVTVQLQVAAADLVFAVYSSVYTLVSDYPILRFDPTNFPLVRLPRAGSDRTAGVANDGTRPLTWQAVPLVAVIADDVEKGTNNWTPDGDWHLSSYRSSSSNHAWYAGSEATRKYATGAAATLLSEPVVLEAGALLSFRHWMRAEESADGYYWDGGVVRISLDEGATYTDLTPLGGYPFKIEPNTDSPFPFGTPCFGSNDWITTRVDLSAYAGQTVRVGFFFGADMSTEREGWYIDDVWLGTSRAGGALSLTGSVSGVYAPGLSARPFALRADPAGLAAQADVNGAIRVDHNGAGSGLDLASFRFRRPAFVTVAPSAHGQAAPAQADLLDAESTNIVFTADSGCRIASLLTNGAPVPEPFGFASTSYVMALQGLTSDLLATARYARVWSVSVSVTGPGSASPAGLFPMDEGSVTTVVFQAGSGSVIWNLLVDGKPRAGGQTDYAWMVQPVTASVTAVAAFGDLVLTNAPVPVNASYLLSYYPSALDLAALNLADTDGDGLATWEELAAATVPTNAASVLRLNDGPRLSPSDPALVGLSFESVPGKIYQAETATSVTGAWSAIGPTLVATGAVSGLQIRLPEPVASAFFRVAVVP